MRALIGPRAANFHILHFEEIKGDFGPIKTAIFLKKDKRRYFSWVARDAARGESRRPCYGGGGECTTHYPPCCPRTRPFLVCADVSDRLRALGRTLVSFWWFIFYLAQDSGLRFRGVFRSGLYRTQD